MNVSRRKFVSGSVVGGLLSIAGCMGDSDSDSTAPSDGEETENGNVFVWSNSNADIEAGVRSSVDGSEFTIEFIVAQFVDVVWVVVDEPEDGSERLTGTDVSVSPLREYGAVEGSVLYNESGSSVGGVGESVTIDCSGVGSVSVSVYGALLSDGEVSTVDVLNVYQVTV